MIKLLTGLTLLGMIPFAHAASITNATNLANHLISLPDKELVEVLQRPGMFGSCLLQKPVASSGCEFRIKTAKGTMMCFNNHPTIPVVGVIQGNWQQNPGAASFATFHEFMNSKRTVIAASGGTALQRAASFARELLASPSTCGLSVSNVQTSVSKNLDHFSLNNVTYYKQLNGNEYCKTAEFSRPVWSASTCSYTQKPVFLPNDTCKTIKSKLSKQVTVTSNFVFPVQVSTPAIALDFAISQLSVSQLASLEVASTELPLFDAISAEALIIGELNPAQLTSAIANPAQKPQVAAFYQAVTAAGSNSAIAIPAHFNDLSVTISAHPSVVTLASSLPAFNPAPMLNASISYLQNLDLTIQGTVQAAGFTAPAHIFALPQRCELPVMAPAAATM